jgi:hypothetical protein
MIQFETNHIVYLLGSISYCLCFIDFIFLQFNRFLYNYLLKMFKDVKLLFEGFVFASNKY